MNIELLEQVKAHILSKPAALDMYDWWRPNCNTVGCIAGWGCALAGTPLPSEVCGTPVQAIEVFGISPAEAERLFHVEEWPGKFNNAYRFESFGEDEDGFSVDAGLDRPGELARITADRISHFIATEGRE